jgi:energy-converting hydrogenase B subunit Q
MENSSAKTAFWIRIKNVIGALRDVSTVIAESEGNIVYIEQFGEHDEHGAHLYLEIEGLKDTEKLIKNLVKLNAIIDVKIVPTFGEIYGKRVIVIGGGAQVAEVATGAISEADRHNIRGEKISVDTIPLIGEKEIANAVRAVARLPRAKILILAGSLMGGEITQAVKEVQKEGISVISLSMAGSVPKAADLVVSDPLQAGVMAVMAIANTAKFDLNKVRGKTF